VSTARANGAPVFTEAPATLLVVEDEVLLRQTICDALREDGYKVLEASSAREAIAALKALHIDLAFIDLHIPGEGDGLSVARFIRESAPQTRIVLTSGKVRFASVGEQNEFGPFIPKPYLIVRVLDIVQESLTLD
jgi:CheY-like chemotaxis protein